MHALLVLAALAAEPPAAEPTPAAPIAVVPEAIAWRPVPATMPKGAEVAVLEGDPAKSGIVTMRLRMPKGYRLGAHTHPVDERVVVLSGRMRVTYLDGPAAVEANSGRVFGAGGFYVTPKGTTHAFVAEEATVIQITVQGPWGVTPVAAPPPASPR